MRLDDFVGVASETAERLVHVSDEGDGFFAHAFGGFDHQLGQADGVFFSLHEGAGAGFDVEHQRIDSFGKFLAHDGGADQANIFDRGGDVAQGVDFFVGGSDFGGLADQGHAAFAKDAAKIGQRQRGVESGDGFEFIEGAAGVAEAAAADHRNVEAARSDDWREDQRSLVANAAGGVLVHFFCGEFGESDDFAGVQHGFGQAGDFRSAEAADPGGHQPGGHLVVGNFAAGIAGDQEINFFAGVFSRIAFFADKVNGAHVVWTNGERNIGDMGRQTNWGNPAIDVIPILCFREFSSSSMPSECGPAAARSAKAALRDVRLLICPPDTCRPGYEMPVCTALRDIRSRTGSGLANSQRGGASSASKEASCSSQASEGVCRRRTQRFQRRMESSLPAGRIFSASAKQ